MSLPSKHSLKQLALCLALALALRCCVNPHFSPVLSLPRLRKSCLACLSELETAALIGIREEDPLAESDVALCSMNDLAPRGSSF